MSIKQRNGIWWLDLRAPSGERIRRSTGTKDRRAAQEYHDRVKADLWRAAKLGEAPERIFEEAAEKFLAAYEGHKSYSTKVAHIAYWLTQFSGWGLSSLTNGEISARVPTHGVRGSGKPRRLTPATQNRYVATIKRMLSMCVEWGWLRQAPKAPKQKEPKVRIRWITEQQARALLHELEGSPWMRDVTAFALATGMRASEILQLEWGEVDMDRCYAWVEAGRAKSSVARTVPLNADAMAVLKRRHGIHERYVFARVSKPAKQVDAKIFRAALERAGIENFRFHDLRHTWASWHVQRGTPLMVLKELGGWETLEMVQKYAHLAPSHLAAHAAVVTFWAQHEPETQKPPSLVAVSA